jgi:hypothetical protein
MAVPGAAQSAGLHLLFAGKIPFPSIDRIRLFQSFPYHAAEAREEFSAPTPGCPGFPGWDRNHWDGSALWYGTASAAASPSHRDARALAAGNFTQK